MRSGFFLLTATISAGLGLTTLSSAAFAQESGFRLTASAELPEAPQPQQAPAATPEQPPVSHGSSSSQAAQPPLNAGKSQHEKADEQIKEEEKQRVVGILPQFNISYRSDAASMSAGQKMHLAFRSSTDPVTFAAAFVVAGYHEARNDQTGFPWGAKGYGERAGAAYLDAFDGTILGNGVFPSILHQDPRYFRLGHGTVTHRLLYSLATNVIAKHDNTGKWEPNYSNVLGNIAAGGISNLYYPSSNSGISQTFTNGFLVTAEGGIGSLFDEFWPDVSRKFLHRDPTHGLDAQLRAADKAAKQPAIK